MRKSTLTKLLCLAIVCLMVLPMIISCGSKVTISLDPGEGTLSEEQMILKVKKNGPIGALPTPKRPGYKFDGWYAEDDTDFEDKYRQSSIALFDITLVAKWEVDAENPPINIYFDAGDGELAEGVSDTLVMISGTTIGELPTPTQDGYKFDGWYLESDTIFADKINKQSKFSGDAEETIVLVAKWKKIIYCVDGTENHQWSLWDEYTQATCETPQQDVRKCTACGESEYKDGAKALGHQWSAWSEGVLTQTRTCPQCTKTETINYKNVTQEALGPGNLPKIDGSYYDLVSPGILVDKNFDNEHSATIAGRGGELRITLELITPTYVDVIYVKGEAGGTGPYDVYYYTEDGEQHYAGMGAIGSLCKFECGATVTKVEFYMANSAKGTDCWQEIALCINPDTKE